MARRRLSSISAPITVGVVTIALAITLLVGWTILLYTRDLPGQTDNWLLVMGIISFSLIIIGLLFFVVVLVRTMLEARRHVSFIDSVTHELKSPLASLRLLLETQARPGVSEAQRTQMRRMMLSDVERLTAFIDDVLVANRIEHGGRVGELTRVRLADLGQRCASRVEARHQSPGSIQVEVPPEVSVVTDVTALAANRFAQRIFC